MPPPSLLVIDDTPAALGVVCDMLRREGVRVLLADSGTAAREVLARNQPDLILLDVMMPGEDGYTVCASLRAHATWSTIPVIFLTAVDSAEQKVSAFAAGAVDYITKPVHVPELIARVRVHLELQAARRTVEAKNRALEAEITIRLDAEEQLATSLKQAVLVLDHTGNTLFSTRLASDLLAKYFPTERPSTFTLGGRFPFDDGTLIVHRFAEAGRDETIMLTLEEEHAPPGPAALLTLGLTVRQAEVAYWVAQGKSNSETAIILGTSPRTVDKHMERIFERLGIENRSALIVTVGEQLRAPQH